MLSREIGRASLLYVSEASRLCPLLNNPPAFSSDERGNAWRLRFRLGEAPSREASLIGPEIMFSNNITGLGEICYDSESLMRILVVEDDEKIASFVVNGLKQSGFAVDRAKGLASDFSELIDNHLMPPSFA